jgi:hypothetical protein
MPGEGVPIAQVADVQQYVSVMNKITDAQAAEFSSAWMKITFCYIVPFLWQGFWEVLVLQAVKLCSRGDTPQTNWYKWLYPKFKKFNLFAIFAVSGVSTLVISLATFNGANSQSQVEWATLAGLAIAESVGRSILLAYWEDPSKKKHLGNGSTLVRFIAVSTGFVLPMIVNDAPQLQQYFLYAGYLRILAGLESENLHEMDLHVIPQLFEFASSILLIIAASLIAVGPALPSFFIPYSRVALVTPFLISSGWTISILSFAIGLSMYIAWEVIPSLTKAWGTAEGTGRYPSSKKMTSGRIGGSSGL